MRRRLLIASMVALCAASAPVWLFELVYQLALSRGDLPQPWPLTADESIPPLAAEALWTAEVGYCSEPTHLWVGTFLQDMWNPLRGDPCRWAPVLGARLLVHRDSGRKLDQVIREAALSVWLSRRSSAADLKQVLAARSYLGRGAVGMEEGASRWFGRDVRSLDVAQLALLAGLARAPGRYDPVVDPERALQRRDYVLRALFKAGMISAPELVAARAEPLGVLAECRVQSELTRGATQWCRGASRGEEPSASLER